MSLASTVRTLARRPGYAASFVGTLALTVGGAAAVFTLVQAYLLRPPPFPDSDRIDFLAQSNVKPGMDNWGYSIQTFWDLRNKVASYEHIGAFTVAHVLLTGRERGEHITVLEATPSFFDVMRVRPVLGRTFLASEDERSKARVVLLLHGLWQRRYGGDPAIVGKQIQMDGAAYEVIGVMPPDFKFLRSNLYAIRPLNPPQIMIEDRSWWAISVIGLRKPGITIKAAGAEVETHLRQLERQYPTDYEGWHPTIRDVTEFYYPGFRPALRVLLTATLLTLAIGCMNLVSLGFARFQDRRKEMALRLAIGATPWQIARAVLVENVTLGLLALGPAIGIAFAGMHFIVGLLPPQTAPVAYLPDVGFNSLVVAFAAMLIAAAVFAVTLPPLFATNDASSGLVLRGGSTASGGGRVWYGKALIACEAGLAVLLGSGAAVVLHGVAVMNSTPMGFPEKGLLTAEIIPPFGKFDDGPPPDLRNVAFWDELILRARNLPGVQHAAMISRMPVGGLTAYKTELVIAGKPAPEAGKKPLAMYFVASPGLQKTMGIPLFAGRLIEESDRVGQKKAVVINRAAAKAWFAPGENPVGQRIAMDIFRPNPAKAYEIFHEIVGVVNDIRNERIDQNPSPIVYMSYRQEPEGPGILMLRASSDAPLLGPLRRELEAVNRDAAIGQVMWIDEYSVVLTWKARLIGALAALFGILALVLVIIGVYGVIANAARRQRRDFAIRIAIGAQPWIAARQLMIANLVPGFAGMTAGVIGAYYACAYTSQILFDGWRPNPITLALIYAGVGLVILIAALPHAIRVARIDPVESLRET